jgi:hypothetical protein
MPCAPCAASLTPASRSFRGRHALGRAGTAPSVVPSARPVGPLGLSCCGRSTSAFCSCATPMRQSWCRSRSGLRVAERMSTSSAPGRASSRVRARQRVADRTELSCVVARSRRSEVLDLARVGDHMRSFVLYHPQTKCSLYRYSLQRRQHSSEVCVRRVPTGARRLTVKKVVCMTIDCLLKVNWGSPRRPHLTKNDNVLYRNESRINSLKQNKRSPSKNTTKKRVILNSRHQ